MLQGSTAAAKPPDQQQALYCRRQSYHTQQQIEGSGVSLLLVDAGCGLQPALTASQPHANGECQHHH
jgi:hypothetical protein